MRHQKNDNRLSQIHQAITRTFKAHRSWAIIAPILLAPAMAFAATSVTFPVTSSAVPITIPGVKAGDTINVQAGLSSVGDPNEFGQHEPLIVTSSGGFSTTIQVGFTQTFSFKASADGESLNAYISGYDGDEAGFVTVSVNQKQYLSQETKDELQSLANQDAVLAQAALLVAVAQPETAEVAGPFGGVVGLMGALEALIALDPPDPNFTVIATPDVPQLPSAVAGGAITPDEANAFNAWQSNSEQFIGYARAFVTTLNRAQGAYEAGDTTWETTQLDTASLYALTLSTLLTNDIALRTTLQNAMAAAGINHTITSGDVFNFEYSVAVGGLPSSMLNVLTSLGADQATIDMLRNVLGNQDINGAVGVFPAQLGNTDLITVEQQVATMLTDFALAHAKPLAPGQHAKGEGLISVANHPVEFEFAAHLSDGQDDGTAGSLIANLKIEDRSAGVRIHSRDITRVALIGSTVVIDGNYQAADGSTGTFRVLATDNGSPGKGTDSFSITLSNGYAASGTLTNGNVVIRTANRADED